MNNRILRWATQLIALNGVGLAIIVSIQLAFPTNALAAAYTNSCTADVANATTGCRYAGTYCVACAAGVTTCPRVGSTQTLPCPPGSGAGTITISFEGGVCSTCSAP